MTVTMRGDYTAVDALEEVRRRLTAPGYSDTDRVRAALLHMQAFVEGKAQHAPASDTLSLVSHITIPRPHVPHGPLHTPELEADADYLSHAASSIEGGYTVGGYNVTHTVIRLLRDTAEALRAEQGRLS